MPVSSATESTPRAAESRQSNEPSLRIRLFGPMEVRIGSEPLPHLRSRKGLWLLALLAIRSGRGVERDWLAGTLWPENDEASGRRSLRQSLHDLRIALGPEADRLASDEPRTLRLDIRDADVDVVAFDSALARGNLESLDTAVRLYRGPFLEDCGEEWSIESRRQREQAFLGALETLASGAANRREPAVAAGYLRDAVAADPYREDLQRALMESLADAGSPAAALISYRQFRALLAREMAAEPADETTALFQRIRDESRAVSKSRAPQSPPVEHGTDQLPSRRQLPVPLTQLIGRDEDARAVIERLAESRLVTLTGTGGIGKTRLAIQVAAQLCGEFADGAVFVDLAPLEDPDHVSDAVKSSLGAPTGEGRHDSVEDVCRYLSSRRILLLLDNCEHLEQACASLVEALLERCAGLKILATSRRVMRIHGETVWRVPSLALPKTRADKAVSLADIRHVSTFLDFAAIRLFSERARSAESSFEVTPRNTVAVITICSRLDGIPLAIELAAARVKAMSVEKIAARLIEKFRLLLGERNSLPVGNLPRHQTLRARSIGATTCSLSRSGRCCGVWRCSWADGRLRRRRPYAPATPFRNGKFLSC